VWEVVDEQLTKLLLHSLNETFKTTKGREKDWRWISSVDDNNFEIVEHLKGEAA